MGAIGKLFVRQGFVVRAAIVPRGKTRNEKQHFFFEKFFRRFNKTAFVRS